MKIKTGSAEFYLKANQPLCLHSAKNVKIACTEGILWITTGGNDKDIFLSPGQSFQVPNNGLTLIESINEGKCRLTNPRLIAQGIQWAKAWHIKLGQWFEFA